MKFRKKSIVVEADQWFSGKEIEGVKERIVDVLGVKVKEFFLETLEGEMQLKAGDWVITGVNGEKYPCKSDIFEKTYERVEE